MLLSALFLQELGGINNFKESSYFTMTEGDEATVYIQLRDNSVNTAQQGFVPVGRRYIPVAGASLSVVVPSIDPSKQIVKLCSQPFAQDPSIWMFQISATDRIRGTQDLALTLSEAGKISRGLVKAGFRVSQASANPPF